jgi:hypothetical protein
MDSRTPVKPARFTLRPRNAGDVAMIADRLRALSESIRKAVVVTVDRPRSNAQNGRLWALYTEIQRQRLAMTGELWPVEELHEHCKRRILGMRQTALGDLVPHSTAKEGTDAFGQYCDAVMRIAAEEWQVDWRGWD